MDITPYDVNWNILPTITSDNYISFIWHEKLFSVGTWQIVLNEKIPDFGRIYPPGFVEAAVVEYEEIENETTTYGGRMLKSELAQRIIHNIENFENKTPDEIAKYLVGKYTDIPTDTAPTPSPSIEAAQVVGKDVLAYTNDLLKTDQIYSRVVFDYDTKEKLFVTEIVTDNTESRPPLSAQSGNVLPVFSFESDMTSYKNYAYVVYIKNDNTELKVEVDNRQSEEAKREVYIDYSSDIKSEGLSDAQIIAIMRQQGLEELKTLTPFYNVDITPTKNLELGEKRIYRNDQHNIEAEITVVEMITTIEKGLTKKTAVLQADNIRRFL